MRTYINLLATQSILYEECIQSKQNATVLTTKLLKQLGIRPDVGKVLFISSNRELSQGLIEAVRRLK